MGGNKGGGTTVSSNAPPPEFTAAYQAVNQQAQQVASTPYQPYTGQLVAQLSPDQTAGIGQVQDLTANGGVQKPYLDTAQNNLTAATQPLLTPELQGKLDTNSGQALVPATANAVSGIQGAANAGTTGITGAAAGLTPASMNQWQDPYTQEVVDSTQAQFNNQNEQQQAQVAGDAISHGAFGGDREAVAQALAIQQEQLAQAPVIAGLKDKGFTTALGAAQNQAALQTQAATSAGSLGLQGAQAAGQAGMTGATTESQLGLQGAQAGLGATEANAWLNSQAAAAEAALGSEAQQTGLQGASALLSAGGLEQQMAQENLNIPAQQFTAAQAYPFQTTGWLANIAEGLGGASGGTSTTTSPGASIGSQVGGLATGALGTLGVTGAFGNNGYLTGANGLFGSGASSGSGMSPSTYAAASYLDGNAPVAKRGGSIGHRASGGMTGYASGGSPIDESASVVPGADGMGAAAPSHGTPLILKNYGSTSTTSGGGDSLFGSLVKAGIDVAGAGFGGPAGAVGANLATSQMHFNHGGMMPQRADGGPTDTTFVSSGSGDPWYSPLVQENFNAQMAAALAPPDQPAMQSGGMVPQHFAVGGFSAGEESPWWTRNQERQSTERHGLLTSPIAGRTDKLAVSPAAGSYVIPADVISGLGEGNTLSGANVMQRILETGPHGTPMPTIRSARSMPHPPPAYREGESDSGMASGGEVAPHYAAGGMSPAVTSYLAGNGLGGFGLPAGAGSASTVPSTGINASTGQGKSNTGLASLDAYLNNTQAGASYAKPTVYTPTPPAMQAAVVPATVPAVGNTAKIADAGARSHAKGGTVRDQVDEGGDVGSEAPMESTQDGADTALPVPPIPPSEPPSEPPSRHGTILRPQSDIVVSDGMQPPSTPSASATSSSAKSAAPHAEHDYDSYMSKLHPAEVNPWLPLAMAGFSAAAGRSPQALQNIGAGAAKGLSMYAQQKQEATKEGLQAAETAQRLADTAAYRDDTIGWRNRNVDAKFDQNDVRRMQVDTGNALKLRAQELQSRGLDIRAAHDQAMEELANGKLDVSRFSADTARTGMTNRNTLGLATLAQKQEQQDTLEAFRQAKLKADSEHRQLTAEEQKYWHDRMYSVHLTNQDIQVAKAVSPVTGKVLFPNPVAKRQEMTAGNEAPPVRSTMPPPAATSPPPLGSFFQ